MDKTRDTRSIQGDGDEIDLLALVRTVWRGKWTIALVMFSAFAPAVIYLYFVAVPMYRSTAVIALDSQQQNVVTDIESVLSGMGSDAATLNTEAVVLKSRILGGKLVDELELITDPEFNELLQPKPKYSLRAMLRQMLGRAEPPVPLPEEIRNAVIDNVLRAMEVSYLRQSLVFEVSVTSANRSKAATIANDLARLYIENQLQEKLDATDSAIRFLSDQTAKLQIELQVFEAKLKAFNESTELVSMEVLGGLQRQVKELRERISGARAATAATETRLSSLGVLAAAGDPEAFAAFADDPRLDDLIPRWKAGNINDTALQSAVQAVVLRAESEVKEADDQLSALVMSEATLDALISRQSDELVRQQELTRSVETTRLMYESFLQRLKETSVQRGLQEPDSRLLSEAVPRPAISPRRTLVAAVALVLGALIGMAIVMAREMLFASFRTSDELRLHTGQSVLGAIPVIPGSARKDALKYQRDKPTSVIAEAVRNLRTSILLSNVDNPPKVILITSSVPGEGKTTLALSLAQNMAGLGKRVILIEGDIRKRIFAEYFDVKAGVSLLEALTDPGSLANAELRQMDIGVDLLVAAKTNVNAADLFASDKFADLLTELRKGYDYILIDTPPVLAVPDARIIGPLADAIIYVVLWNSTTRTQVRQGLEMFSSVGLKVSGLVLNRVDSRQMKRYGYAGQYGYDAYRSKYYDV